MEEKFRNRFIEIHSVKVSQYILGLNDLPLKEEFIENYRKLSTTRKKKKSARKTYEFLEKYGLL